MYLENSKVLVLCLSAFKCTWPHVWFDYTISYVPGKLLYVADALTRAPISNSDLEHFDQGAELFVQSGISYLPASKDRLDVFRTAQSEDSTCVKLMTFCRQGWPNNKEIEGDFITVQCC